MKNENPKYNATDITEELGKEWRKLSDKERNFYQEEFTRKYETFKTDLKEYYEKRGINPADIKLEKKKVSGGSQRRKKRGKTARALWANETS